MTLPSDAAVVERAWSLVKEGMNTISLQRRRLRSSEPEDEEFGSRWWVDLQFLIVALRRLRSAAKLAASVPAAKLAMEAAIQQFDNDLPMLAKMRNVGEHIDEYALDSDRRRHKEVKRFDLHVGTFNGTTYEWLGDKINIDEALAAATRLWGTMQSVVRTWPKSDLGNHA